MPITPVPDDMIHPELRHIAHSPMVRIYGVLFRYRMGFKIASVLRGRAKGMDIDGLICQHIYIPSTDPHQTRSVKSIRTRIYRPQGFDKPMPIFLYVHGGGYAFGCPEMAGPFIKAYIKKRPCIIVAPDYRKSLKHPFPAGFNDGYDVLLWIRDNMNILGGNGHIIVGGHSAGGGMTAALTLRARNTGSVKIAFQMPHYPMLDYRQNTPSSTLNSPFWGVHANALAWKLYLATLCKKGEHISPYASPSINTDYTDFPPTITFVGDIEPFYHETVHYIHALQNHKIPVLYKIYSGAYHAFDMPLLFGDLKISQHALQFQLNAFAEFYDTYAAS